MTTETRKGKRPYRMVKRAASTEKTRQRIIDAQWDLALDLWYDEITLRKVAARAGVSLRTVVNHFGSKEAILAAALEQPVPEELMTRVNAKPDDIRGAIRLLVQDYEKGGDAAIRVLFLEDRIPAVKPLVERGRRLLREWVETTFPAALSALDGTARERRIDLLVCSTSAYTWKILRRDRGLSQAQTADAMCQLVEALHQ